MTDLGADQRDRPCNRRWLLRHGAAGTPVHPCRHNRRAPSSGSARSRTARVRAFAELDAVRRALGSQPPVFLGDEVVTGVASRLGNAARPRYDDQALGEQARLKIDRFLVDAGGEIDAALRAVAIRSTAAQRARGGARFRKPLRADRGNAHAILRRAEQRAFRRCSPRAAR